MRALVFDFDGLILDTETSVYEAWRIVYEEHDQVLPRDRWLTRIGTDGSAFDPLLELRERVGETLDAEQIKQRRMAYHRAHIEKLDQMPGVRACLEHARAESIGTAIASSSPFYWVSGHVERLGLTPFFDQIVTAEHVSAAKPAPDLYLRATELLGVDPRDAIALEDSPNGVQSAKAAGLYCIAVPGPMTRTLCFEGADSVMASLDERPAGEWIAQAAAARDADRRVSSSR
ncbi:MAG: HAD family hydrolase [Deltaproteobacteria bacterium]|jgi:HAD superfamily hydrolase (TIGR01509 family)|nr:HAD family hydrolase [Deltaproteobacteria bacterium]